MHLRIGANRPPTTVFISNKCEWVPFGSMETTKTKLSFSPSPVAWPVYSNTHTPEKRSCDRCFLSLPLHTAVGVIAVTAAVTECAVLLLSMLAIKNTLIPILWARQQQQNNNNGDERAVATFFHSLS